MGFFLLLPFFLIRFGLLSRLAPDAVARVAYYAPLLEWEKPAYWTYQVSNLAIFLLILFSRVRYAPPLLFYTGVCVYAAGTILLAVSMVHFAAPSQGALTKVDYTASPATPCTWPILSFSWAVCWSPSPCRFCSSF